MSSPPATTCIKTRSMDNPTAKAPATRAIDAVCPIAMGSRACSAFALSPERRPPAAANIHPFAGFNPCRAPRPATAIHGQNISMTCSPTQQARLRVRRAARTACWFWCRFITIMVTHPVHLVRCVFLVAAFGREIQHLVRAHHDFNAAPEGRVSVKDFAGVVLVKQADAGRFLRRERGHAVVVVDLTL